MKDCTILSYYTLCAKQTNHVYLIGNPWGLVLKSDNPNRWSYSKQMKMSSCCLNLFQTASIIMFDFESPSWCSGYCIWRGTGRISVGIFQNGRICARSSYNLSQSSSEIIIVYFTYVSPGPSFYMPKTIIRLLHCFESWWYWLPADRSEGAVISDF